MWALIKGQLAVGEVGFTHLNLCVLIGVLEIYNGILGRSHFRPKEGSIDAGTWLLLEAGEHQ